MVQVSSNIHETFDDLFSYLIGRTFFSVGINFLGAAYIPLWTMEHGGVQANL